MKLDTPGIFTYPESLMGLKAIFSQDKCIRGQLNYTLGVKHVDLKSFRQSLEQGVSITAKE